MIDCDDDESLSVTIQEKIHKGFYALKDNGRRRCRRHMRTRPKDGKPAEQVRKYSGARASEVSLGGGRGLSHK